MKLDLKVIFFYPLRGISPNLAKSMPFLISPEKLNLVPDDKPKLHVCRIATNRFVLNLLTIQGVPVMNLTKSTIKIRGRFP
jgi:hypothetical protein